MLTSLPAPLGIIAAGQNHRVRAVGAGRSVLTSFNKTEGVGRYSMLVSVDKKLRIERGSDDLIFGIPVLSGDTGV